MPSMEMPDWNIPVNVTVTLYLRNGAELNGLVVRCDHAVVDLTLKSGQLARVALHAVDAVIHDGQLPARRLRSVPVLEAC